MVFLGPQVGPGTADRRQVSWDILRVPGRQYLVLGPVRAGNGSFRQVILAVRAFASFRLNGARYSNFPLTTRPNDSYVYLTLDCEKGHNYG